MLCYGALALSVLALGFAPNHFERASAPESRTAISIDDLQSPWIEGTTLHIEGPIDSHIYDYLAYEAKSLKSIKAVEMNSWGGNIDWALQISQKLKDLSIDTVVREGDVCTSACVVLYASGRHRLATAGNWFGIQGAQLGVLYTTRFKGLCFGEDQSGISVFDSGLKGCDEFLKNWSALVGETTARIFQSMEQNGVLPSLRQNYYALPDEKNWSKNINIFKKPKWTVPAAAALKYNLVTEIMAETAP